jgi:16S rRNA (guanine1516-N2)-methyltransferase
MMLINAALLIAKKRVVVKRSKLAPTLTDKKPDVVFMGKSSRFDVYLKILPLAALRAAHDLLLQRR